MAQATNPSITSRFHNLSNGQLADALGHADAVLKGAEAEALKDEIKRRGLLEATGDSFAIRVSEQISGRLDIPAVKHYLGESWRRFEVATVSPADGDNGGIVDDEPSLGSLDGRMSQLRWAEAGRSVLWPGEELRTR